MRVFLFAFVVFEVLLNLSFISAYLIFVGPLRSIILPMASPLHAELGPVPLLAMACLIFITSHIGIFACLVKSKRWAETVLFAANTNP